MPWYRAKDMVPYSLRDSARAKHLRVTVYPSGDVVVTRPEGVSQSRAERFVAERQEWIEAARARLVLREAHRRARSGGVAIPKLRRGSVAHTQAIRRARELVHTRLPELNLVYGFRYGRVAIRDQKTRWGSCSPKGNLNFNYNIVFLTPALIDYLLVHELCHLKEMNHSPRFWALVAKRVPDYQKLRTQLRAVSIG